MAKYKVDTNVFNVIDTEEKAYWIGFIWCDGYNLKRNRSGFDTYEFKLSLAECDIDHLHKFKKFLNSEHPIKIYKPNSCFKNYQNESRILIANTELGRKLDELYGLISHRSDAAKLIKSIPGNLVKHFIRGVVDADGSIGIYTINDARRKKPSRKAAIGISTYEEILKFINSYLTNNKIMLSEQKLSKRHKDRDGECFTIKICGNINVLNILEYLYKDANIYLDRKYKRFLDIENELKII